MQVAEVGRDERHLHHGQVVDGELVVTSADDALVLEVATARSMTLRWR